MAIKKSELYSALWESCDNLRGGMDPSQYKDYILVLLFVKYVSDKYAGRSDALLEVPEGASFRDMVALKGNPEIGEKMNIIVVKLAEANAISIPVDFNDESKLGKGKDMVDRLSQLVAIFDSPTLDFKSNRADGDDLLGDAYEYLMRHFATDSGKSKGQFYTPAEVSRIMAKVIGVGTAERSDQTIYDPTCGSGSLLLKVHDEARYRAGRALTIYGQEMDNTTAGLAKMNMILHDCPTADIWQDNTLSNPYFKEKNGTLKTFDFIVANPPFSFKSWSRGVSLGNDPFHRFQYGTPPDKNGDYAFLLHILASLKSRGKGAVILPHGVLFRGNAEATIRTNLIQRGFIKGIIGLPPNLFYGTGIPACIIVLDKEGASGRTGIFLMDAAKGFRKDGNKNRLREQDIHRIVDVFTRQLEIPGYSHFALNEEIYRNDCNLNLPRYIDGTEAEDIQDIDAHLNGGIPNRDVDALSRYWSVFPGVRDAVFAPDRPGYVALKTAPAEIKPAIFGHPEFATFTDTVTALFAAWRTENEPLLQAIAIGTKPKILIETLSENLLASFLTAPLVDAYDVYQHLMDFWNETMQDDVYLIATDGWENAARLQLMIEDPNRKSKEKPDFVINKKRYKADLIPPALLIARYFPAEQAQIEVLEADLATAEAAAEEYADENGGEDGLLAEARDDNGKLPRAAILARIKAIKDEPDADDERNVLTHYRDLLDAATDANNRVRAARAELDGKVIFQYATLTEAEVKTLVIGDKWLATLDAAVQSEIDRVSQGLTGRVRELAERYATPLSVLTAEVAEQADRVDAHLAKMGTTLWK